jgi:hypothetical protein
MVGSAIHPPVQTGANVRWRYVNAFTLELPLRLCMPYVYAIVLF